MTISHGYYLAPFCKWGNWDREIKSCVQSDTATTGYSQNLKARFLTLYLYPFHRWCSSSLRNKAQNKVGARARYGLRRVLLSVNIPTKTQEFRTDFIEDHCLRWYIECYAVLCFFMFTSNGCVFLMITFSVFFQYTLILASLQLFAC